MKFGLPISVSFHALAAFGGLLLWSGGVEPLANVRIIPLELVTVSDITDIKPKRTEDEKPKPDEESTKPDIPDAPVDRPELDKAPDTPAPTANTPEPGASTPAPSFDLDALEEAFEDVRKTNPDADTQQVLINEAQRTEIADKARRGEGAGMDSTVAAVDYIRSRMRDCWFVDAGALDFQELVINVELLLNTDGSIRKINVLNNANIIASPNRSWRVARHNALTALRKCAPYDGLLTIDYDIWKELRLHLDPGENQ